MPAGHLVKDFTSVNVYYVLLWALGPSVLLV